MKASKEDEVGHMRSRRGTSMKMMMKQQTLVRGLVSQHALSRGGGEGLSLRLVTHRQMMLKRMTQCRAKMFAIPSAKQRMMHSTPVLSWASAQF